MFPLPFFSTQIHSASLPRQAGTPFSCLKAEIDQRWHWKEL
jgi:hypothetical protein